MNGRKAKALRKGAIENSPDHYKWVEYEVTNQLLKRFKYQDEDGVIQQREMLTYTQVMKPCIRKLYKKAKKLS